MACLWPSTCYHAQALVGQQFKAIGLVLFAVLTFTLHAYAHGVAVGNMAANDAGCCI